MAVDMFLKLLPIKGESLDSKHPDEIDVLAWSWGASQSGNTHYGAGSGSGKVSVQDLSFTHYVDKASADLLAACTRGDHIPEGTLVVRKAGGKDAKALEYIVIGLKNIIVTSVSSGGSGGEDRLTENITLNFGEFKYTYTPQEASGAAGTASSFGWKIPENVEAS